MRNKRLAGQCKRLFVATVINDDATSLRLWSYGETMADFVLMAASSYRAQPSDQKRSKPFPSWCIWLADRHW